MTEYVSTTDTAKLVRAALKKAFASTYPGVKSRCAPTGTPAGRATGSPGPTRLGAGLAPSRTRWPGSATAVNLATR
jgi:hypothetical protein